MDETYVFLERGPTALLTESVMMKEGAAEWPGIGLDLLSLQECRLKEKGPKLSSCHNTDKAPRDPRPDTQY